MKFALAAVRLLRLETSVTETIHTVSIYAAFIFFPKFSFSYILS